MQQAYRALRIIAEAQTIRIVLAPCLISILTLLYPARLALTVR